METSEESIFAKACQKKMPQQRAAILDEACAGNSELRGNVETLLAGIGGTAWQAALATQQRDEATRQRDEAERQRERAERQEQIAQENFQRARAAVDEYLTKVSEEELLSQPGMQPLRKELLDLALKYYREFIQERGDDPTLQAELAAALIRIGNITKAIGDENEATEAYKQAVEIRRKLATDNPGNPTYKKDLAEAYLLGKNQASEKAVEICEELVAANPNVREYQASLAKSLKKLGWASKGNHSLSVASFQKAIEIYEKILTESPDASEQPNDTLSSCYYGLFTRLRQDEPQEALRLLRRAVTLRQERVDADPKNINSQHGLAKCCGDLAFHLQNLHEHEGALGRAEYRSGNYEAAVNALKKSRELPTCEGSEGEFGFYLAMAHWRVGDQGEARRCYEKAVEWMETKEPKEEELKRFRAEASELLGVEDAQPPGDESSRPKDQEGDESKEPDIESESETEAQRPDSQP